METERKPDQMLLGLSAALVGFGVLVLASVSSSFSLQKTGSAFYYLSHQILFGLFPGLVLGIVAYLFPLKRIKALSFFLLLFAIVLLAAVFLPLAGSQLKGATRWIALGSFSFQPSELLKIAFIVYVSAWLANRKGQKLNRGETFAPFIAILTFVALLLVFQRDVSTLGIIVLTGGLLYFLSETPLWHTAVLTLGFLLSLLAMVRFAPYRFSRLAVFLHPNLDPLGQGYHVKQALIGIGSGGLTGVGLGLSFQKFGVLPEPMSDSIFAIFAEEMGFLGAAALIMLFLAFFWRSFVVAQKTQDQFSKLVAMGIASWITLQAFVNIASMAGLLPLAGIPLPFVSYGGSALVSELIGVGLLLNISKQAT